MAARFVFPGRHVNPQLCAAGDGGCGTSSGDGWLWRAAFGVGYACPASPAASVVTWSVVAIHGQPQASIQAGCWWLGVLDWSAATGTVGTARAAESLHWVCRAPPPRRDCGAPVRAPRPSLQSPVALNGPMRWSQHGPDGTCSCRGRPMTRAARRAARRGPRSGQFEDRSGLPPAQDRSLRSRPCTGSGLRVSTRPHARAGCGGMRLAGGGEGCGVAHAHGRRGRRVRPRAAHLGAAWATGGIPAGHGRSPGRGRHRARAASNPVTPDRPRQVLHRGPNASRQPAVLGRSRRGP